MSGYHKREIPKGVVGELSKIYEEIEEVKDAQEQGIELMVLLELSDLLGAVDLYLKHNHPTLTLGDLLAMSRLTQEVFINGFRS